MTEWVWLGIIFGSVSVVCFTALYLAGRGERQLRARLRPEAGDRPLVLGPMTPALAEQLPTTPEGRAGLVKGLRAAGYYEPTAFLEYAAVRAVLVVVPLVAGLALALLVPRRQSLAVAFGGGLAAMLGYSLPRAYLSARARTRSRQIERGLPFAVDLLALCLTAGQSLLAAISRVSRELQGTYPALAYELEVVRQQAEIGSLEHALHQLADRVDVPEVNTLALMLAQSERLGTDAASTLMEFANSLRVNLRQRAEATANRTSFWMLLPTVFLLLPAAALLIMAAPFFEFTRQRTEAMQKLTGAKGEIEKIVPGVTESAPAAEEPQPEIP